MKKLFGILIVGILLLGASVVAEEISLDNKADKFVKDVASMKGVDSEKIKGIKELDLADLPKEVKFENIDETNLALYEIELGEKEKPVYIITASSRFFKETARVFAQKMLLSFGFGGEILQDTFLKASGEVVTSLNKGYVMSRDGSITSISTNLEIVSGQSDIPVEIVIYKDSEEVGFRNSFVVLGGGIYTDYDVISSQTLKFEKGDILSIEVQVPEGVVIRDVITLLEIEV